MLDEINWRKFNQGNESLLEILIDRLARLERGPCACAESLAALNDCVHALNMLRGKNWPES